MRKWLIFLMTLLAVSVQAQRQKISYIEETKNWYYIYDEAGKVLKAMNASDVGEIVGVSGNTITSRCGSWILTWDKDGKKISARSAN